MTFLRFFIYVVILSKLSRLRCLMVFQGNIGALMFVLMQDEVPAFCRKKDFLIFVISEKVGTYWAELPSQNEWKYRRISELDTKQIQFARECTWFG